MLDIEYITCLLGERRGGKPDMAPSETTSGLRRDTRQYALRAQKNSTGARVAQPCRAHTTASAAPTLPGLLGGCAGRETLGPCVQASPAPAPWQLIPGFRWPATIARTSNGHRFRSASRGG